jgi:hypothetical protein
VRRPSVQNGRNRLRESENGMLREIFVRERDGVTGGGANYVTGSIVICTAHQILFG